MPRARRNFIAVDNRMPRHPKIEPLSDAAFRLLVTLWCECDEHETDGHVKAATWNRRGTAKARRELLDSGMAEPVGDDYLMHDYLDHQRSAAEIHELREKRSAAGAKGGKARALAIADAKQTTEQEPQHVPRQTGSKAVAETGTEDRGQRQERTTQGEQRPETLSETVATDRPPDTPHDRYRCTVHQGVTNPPPCMGCKTARERAEADDARTDDREREQRERELEQLRATCPDCEGTGKILNPDKTPTRQTCTHPNARRTA